MIECDSLSNKPEDIKQMWHISPDPSYKKTWILYTKNFVLEALQGCHGYPEKVKHNFLWRSIGTCVWLIMVLSQVIIIFFCYIPVITDLMYMLAKAFPRNPVGFFLRGCYWKSKLKHLGVDTIIDQGVEINGPDLVEAGNCCHIDRNVLLSVGAKRGRIIIGDNVFIGPYCHIAGRGGVEIESFAALAAHVHIYSVTNLPYDPKRMGELVSMTHTVPFSQQATIESPVLIGKYAAIGFNSLILPGVNLGLGAIVHAYSEVCSSFPDFAVVSGHGRARQQGWRRPAKLDGRLRAETNCKLMETPDKQADNQ